MSKENTRFIDTFRVLKAGNEKAHKKRLWVERLFAALMTEIKHPVKSTVSMLLGGSSRLFFRRRSKEPTYYEPKPVNPVFAAIKDLILRLHHQMQTRLSAVADLVKATVAQKFDLKDPNDVKTMDATVDKMMSLETFDRVVARPQYQKQAQQLEAEKLAEDWQAEMAAVFDKGLTQLSVNQNDSANLQRHRDIYKNDIAPLLKVQTLELSFEYVRSLRDIMQQAQQQNNNQQEFVVDQPTPTRTPSPLQNLATVCAPGRRAAKLDAPTPTPAPRFVKTL